MTESSKKLVVLMDLGRLKAYRLEENPEFSQPRLVFLEEMPLAGKESISEQVTDQAGQFAKGSLSFAAVSDMSNGEQHNLQLESRRRAIKACARHIAQLLARERLEECYFASASEINRMVMDELDPATRKKIQRNVTANLTNLGTGEILEQFCAPNRSR